MFQLIALFFYILPMSWAQITIPVKATQYKVPEEHPSCRILEYRQLEREEMIRELIHLKGLKETDPATSFMLQNYLHSNKEFLNPELWQDEVVEVSMALKGSPKLALEIDRVGLNELHIYLQGTGVEWQGLVGQAPTDFGFHWTPETQELQIQYKIYLANLCYEYQDNSHFEIFPRQGDVF
jgi:hypothetical protein